jgi:hypothetical protein
MLGRELRRRGRVHAEEVTVDFTAFRGRSGFRDSNCDPGFDGVVIRPETTVRRIEKAGRREGLNIRMDVAVVAPERFRQGAGAGDSVAADVSQEIHPFAGQDAGERIPTLERQMALVKGLASIRAAPCVHEPARRVVFDRWANNDLHAAHLSPLKDRTSDQKIGHQLLDSADRVGCLDILKMPVIAFAALIIVPDLSADRASISACCTQPPRGFRRLTIR